MKIYYKALIREYMKYDCYLINDGYLVIENNNIYGYLTFDIVFGEYDESSKKFMLEITDNNNRQDNYITEIDDLIIPEEYTLMSSFHKNKSIGITFIEKINNPVKQSEIEENFRLIQSRYE